MHQCSRAKLISPHKEECVYKLTGTKSCTSELLWRVGESASLRLNHTAIIYEPASPIVMCQWKVTKKLLLHGTATVSD